MLDPRHARAWNPGANGMLMPYLLVAGKVAGVWKREIKKNGLVLSPRPFQTLSADQTRDLAAAARRYGEFWGAPVEVR